MGSRQTLVTLSFQIIPPHGLSHVAANQISLTNNHVPQVENSLQHTRQNSECYMRKEDDEFQDWKNKAPSSRKDGLFGMGQQ